MMLGKYCTLSAKHDKNPSVRFYTVVIGIHGSRGSFFVSFIVKVNSDTMCVTLYAYVYAHTHILSVTVFERIGKFSVCILLYPQMCGQMCFFEILYMKKFHIARIFIVF